MSNCGGLSPGQRGVCECASVFFFLWGNESQCWSEVGKTEERANKNK